MEFFYFCLECCCEMCILLRDDVVVVIFIDGVNFFGVMFFIFVIIGIINFWLCCVIFGEIGFSWCLTLGDVFIVGDVIYCCGVMRCGVRGDGNGYVNELGLRLEVGVDGWFWFINFGCLLGEIGILLIFNCWDFCCG